MGFDVANLAFVFVVSVRDLNDALSKTEEAVALTKCTQFRAVSLFQFSLIH